MKESKIIRFLVGILTLMLVVPLYGLLTSHNPPYVFNDFFDFIFISIVCTAGVSLIIWIPALILLGTAVIKIFSLFFYDKSKQVSEKTNLALNNELALVGYIVSSRNTGAKMSDEVIRANLKSGGWSDTDIDNAFKKSRQKA